ncbi:MAG TPA: hypothetical protein DCP66_04325 [Collinsella sp.]|nr:hypothetical protein [Collinsella sp.]
MRRLQDAILLGKRLDVRGADGGAVFITAAEGPQRLERKGLALGVGDLAKMVGTAADCPAIQQGGKAANSIGVFGGRKHGVWFKGGQRDDIHIRVVRHGAILSRKKCMAIMLVKR